MRLSPEQSVQLTIVDFTFRFCPEVLLSASQNGVYAGSGKHVGAYINQQKRLGMLVGELDLMLTWPTKNILFVEVKSTGGRLTGNQQIVIEKRTAQGFDCVVVFSLNQYVTYLRRYKVPMRSGVYAGIGFINQN